ncbi:RluA family pseudouridine synthase [Candidatus Bathyarchaeota archaeon]|nr:RluA family pseudouridine synthase [Candidatus Bathyarchaeota archaeon]
MPERQVELLAPEGQERLDKFLARQVPDLSRSAAQRLIDEGRVTVNGEPVRASYKLRPGDHVVAALPSDDQAHEILPEAIPLHVVYEDATLLVVDKPAGMVVHPAPGHAGGTLANALLAHSPELGGQELDPREARPGIVHRLDRDTSGLILLAKTEKARRALQQQFKDRRVDKAYLALVHGHLQPAWGRIEAPIGRDPHRRQRMTVLPGGREAVTEYHVLETFSRQAGPSAGTYSLLQAEPKTGRTHQIRVHLASIGHAVVGDPVYGQRRTHLPLQRQFLHAGHLGFQHPVTGQRLELDAPLPADLADVLELLRNG